MKKYLVLLLCSIVSLAAGAQSITRTSRYRLDSTTVVRDSSGMRYPYEVWRKMMMSGDYTLRPAHPGDSTSALVLYKMNEQQKQAMLARLPLPQESPYFITNKKFTFYNGKTMDGLKINPETMAGKIVVFNFWFVNCPPCRQEIPELNKLVEQYKDNKDIIFVAAALDGTADVREFLKTQPFAYHIITDSRYLTNKYRMNGFPTNVVVDKQGNVRFHTTGYGPGTANWIRKTIEQVKAE